MFHIKDHKTYDLFDPYPHFGPKRRTLLENSWAKIFREDILPILPVHLLRDHFHDTHGRPTKELFTMLGLMVIQQNEDLTDEETVFQVAFNELWHYALDIRSNADDSTYICQKSLWNMRNRLIKHNLYDSIFDSITNQLAKVCEVDTSKQRLDSMHIKSNMRHLGRIGLFISTIKKFLCNLKRQHKDLYTSIEQELLDRYFSKRGESAFAMVKPSAAGKTLETLAQDLFSLVERFRLVEKVCGMNTYQLLVRLLKEQCHVEEDSISSTKKVTVKSNKEVPSDSLQNPSDPDAGYSGHKGKGYQVQIMETYSPEEKKDDKQLSLITYVEVEPAKESDANALLPAIKDTKKRGLAPEELLADSLYGSDDNHEKAQGEGVEVIAPTMGRSSNDKITLSDFTLVSANKPHLFFSPAPVSLWDSLKRSRRIIPMTKRTTRNKQPCSQRHWQAHVNALNNSGLSRAEYCRQQSLSYNALTYWHRKLSRPSTNTTTLVPVAIRPNIGQNIVQPDQAELKIILPGKMSVAVGDNFSPKTLTRLLATLESR